MADMHLDSDSETTDRKAERILYGEWDIPATIGSWPINDGVVYAYGA